MKEHLSFSKYNLDRKMHNLQIIINSKRDINVSVAGMFLLLFVDKNVVDQGVITKESELCL